MERPIEAWEEMQRHGQDFVDKMAQGVAGLIHFPPAPAFPKAPGIQFPPAPAMLDGIGKAAPAVLDEIGGRIGQAAGSAGAEIGKAFEGIVQQFLMRVPPIGWRIEEEKALTIYDPRSVSHTSSSPVQLEPKWSVNGLEMEKTGDDNKSSIAPKWSMTELEMEKTGDDNKSNDALKWSVTELEMEKTRDNNKSNDLPKLPDLAIGTTGTEELNNTDEEFETEIGNFASQLKKPKGTINMSCTYETRSRSLSDTSFTARGEIWRLDASRGGSNGSNGSNGSTDSSAQSSLFLVQLGPLILVKDSALLLPVHLSKQHLLWYGYDRKAGLHSLCPAVWSKHRKYALMAMICLNPLACSFLDLQVPNGQMTYMSGEGWTMNTFIPFLGGLLQAQGKYPGETRLSFSCRNNKLGTRVTPAVRLPDKSFSLEINQEMVYKESGVMIRPTVQLSVCPTFGGTNPGLRAEIVHTLKEEINLICGFSSSLHPSAFASLSVGRSKWNGNVGTSGVVISLETPLNNFGNPNLSVQLNGGFEF